MFRTKAIMALIAIISLTAPAIAGDFNLEKVIEAARKEPPLTVYDNTSKIKKMAKAFAAKYGVEAVGVKVRTPQQVELVSREAAAGAIQGDVVNLADVAAGQLELLPQGIMVSWMPPLLADKIPAKFQNPLVINYDPKVFAYNTETEASSPIDNIWALTEPEMKGRVAMQDPLNNPALADFFNQMQIQADKAVAEAYKARYNKPLETKEASATAAWVAALAKNGPLLTESDQAVSDAVGAPGQKTSMVGLLASAKFRDNKGKGYKLGLCTGVAPIAGYAKPKLILMSPKTDSPNAAKLFIHYAMTPEGLAPQTGDGKMPTNTDDKLPESEPAGVAKIADDLLFFDAATASKDFDQRQDWQDFWRMNYKR